MGERLQESPGTAGRGRKRRPEMGVVDLVGANPGPPEARKKAPAVPPGQDLDKRHGVRVRRSVLDVGKEPAITSLPEAPPDHTAQEHGADPVEGRVLVVKADDREPAGTEDAADLVYGLLGPGRVVEHAEGVDNIEGAVGEGKGFGVPPHRPRDQVLELEVAAGQPTATQPEVQAG